MRTVGRAVGTTIRAGRAVARGTASSGRWAGRTMGEVRRKGAGGESGMARLFDLHAASCAGDTLITVGLAGTIFFSAPLGEARSKVALYLLVTMVPFALLAPVVGPLLDHFRHGRRYALAATMLGRAFLAWLISDYIHGFGLYPAAFGVLALSRAYGVARSAAVPRLLPQRLGLSQAGARASVYGTVAGAAVVPLGLAAFQFGPQWPLRVASIIFLIGMVYALRLPPRADSDPPETVPRVFRLPWLRPASGAKVLTGRLVIAAIAGSGTLRALYGFLLLFLAFTIKGGDLPVLVFGMDFGEGFALGLIGGALGVGTFLATAIGTRLNIHRPAVLQAGGLALVTIAGALAALRFTLLTVALFCLVTALASGLAKLAVDATIQERIDERFRASAFAHAETILMLAWVAGGGLGLIPVHGRIGVVAAVGFAALALLRAFLVAGRLRHERLYGRAATDPTALATDGWADGGGAARRTGGPERAGAHATPRADAAPPSAAAFPPVDPWADTADSSPAGSAPGPGAFQPGGTGSAAGTASAAGTGSASGTAADSGAGGGRTGQRAAEAGGGRRRIRPFSRAPRQGTPPDAPMSPVAGSVPDPLDDEALAPPGFHIYRPGAPRPARDDSPLSPKKPPSPTKPPSAEKPPSPKNRSGE